MQSPLNVHSVILRYSTPILLAVIILLGFLLRAYDLGRRDLWFDEAMSVSSSANLAKLAPSSADNIPYGNPTMGTKPAVFKTIDPHPPFYYILLHLWISLFDNTATTLRALSLCAGILTIPLIFTAGKLLVDTRTGLYAAALLAISPLHISYAQEARGYTLSVLLTLSAFYLFYTAQKKQRSRSWGIFLAIMLLAIYTNYFSLLLLIPCWIYIMSQRDRHLLWQWLIVNLILMVVLTPWLPLLAQHVTFVKTAFWIPKPTPASLTTTLENFNLGYTGEAYAYTLSLAVSSLLLTAAAFHLKGHTLSLLLLFFILPLGSTYLISQKFAIYIDRQLMLFSPFFYLIMAAGLTHIRFCTTRAILLICILWGTTTSLQNYYTDEMPIKAFRHHLGMYIKKPIQPALRYIDRNWQESDVLVCGHSSILVPMQYYIKHLNLKLSGKKSDQHQRLWLLSSSWARNGALDADSELLRKRISDYYEHSQTFSFEGIYVDLFIFNQNKIQKFVEGLLRDAPLGQEPKDGTPDIHKIQEAVVHKFSSLAAKGSSGLVALPPLTLKPNDNTHTKDPFYFLHSNIIFYITNLAVQNLHINNNEAQGTITCSFETFNRITLSWITGTCNLDTQFKLMNDEWMIQSWKAIRNTNN